jgi:hypothetical protein
LLFRIAESIPINRGFPNRKLSGSRRVGISVLLQLTARVFPEWLGQAAALNFLFGVRNLLCESCAPELAVGVNLDRSVCLQRDEHRELLTGVTHAGKQAQPTHPTCYASS